MKIVKNNKVKTKKSKFAKANVSIFVCSECGKEGEICIGNLGSQLCKACYQKINQEQGEKYKGRFVDDTKGR